MASAQGRSGRAGAGYSGTPLVKKLGIRPGARVLISGAPADFAATLGPLPEGARRLGAGARDADVTLLFAARAARLAPAFAARAERLRPGDALWACWPKKTSGLESDLSFERVQALGLDAGLVDVKICAVDATWSGLEFTLRRTARAGRSRPARKA